MAFETLDAMFEAALRGKIRAFIAPKLSLFYFLSQRKLAGIFGYVEGDPLFSRPITLPRPKTPPA